MQSKQICKLKFVKTRQMRDLSELSRNGRRSYSTRVSSVALRGKELLPLYMHVYVGVIPLALAYRLLHMYS